jgi:MFS family permease
MAIATSPSRASPSVIAALLPIMTVVLVSFLVIGLALPVLPLHVHQGLGLGTIVVGFVAGSQFAASFVSRLWSGQFADSRGAKKAVIIGLLAAAVSGLLYLLSLALAATPAASVTILLLGRALLGGAESFIITGALSWGLALAGFENTGKVIAWVGTAMYAAFALGAPAGSTLYARYGFMAIALATALAPLLTLLIVLPLRPVAPTMQARPAFTKVLGAIWVPGIGLALSSLGFGAMTAFVTLLFADKGWTPTWAGLTCFALAFIVARSVLGHLPDKAGGAKVALVSVAIEAAGLAVIWMATSAASAMAGAVITGLGYALAYPGFGVEAVRAAPPESRGLAMGAYTACLDLALGIAGPVLGLVATWQGLSSVFLVSALLVLCAAIVALRRRAHPRPADPHQSSRRNEEMRLLAIVPPLPDKIRNQIDILPSENRRKALVAASGIVAAPLLALLAPRTAAAHHGWGTFDTRRAYYVFGTVTNVRWGNPHSEVGLRVQRADLPANWAQRQMPLGGNEQNYRMTMESARSYTGEHQELHLVLAGPNWMERWGLDRRLTAGETLEAVGYLDADGGDDLRPVVFWLADGHGVWQQLTAFPQRPEPALSR